MNSSVRSYAKARNSCRSTVLIVAFTPHIVPGRALSRDKLPGMGRFRKTGLVLEPPAGLPWSASHAAVPFVDPTDVERLYFTTRDEQGRSQVARAALDLE